MKYKVCTRALSLFLVFVMCLGMLPTGALAKDVNPGISPDVFSENSEETKLLEESRALPEPVHYYKLDEAAGEAALDNGTGKKDGAKTSMESAAGKAGNAAHFTGAGYIDVDSSVLNGEAFTVTAWVKWDGGGRINAIMSTAVSGIAGGKALLFYVSGDAGGKIIAGDPVGASLTSTEAVTSDGWTHVAFVKDGANVKLYINGVQDGEKEGSETGTSTYPIRIGANHNTTSHNFHGDIDEVKIFDTALTGDEVTAAMAVPADETAPTLVSSAVPNLTTATLVFSETLEEESAETAANYTATNGVTVTGAALGADGKTVTLTLTGLIAGAKFTIAVNGVKDLANNATSNLVSNELTAPTEPVDASYLEETEKTVPYGDWCKAVAMEIPTHFAQGDTATKLVANGREVTQWSPDVSAGKIVLQSDFWGVFMTDNEIVMEFTFQSGVKDTYTLTRGEKPAELTGWVFQKDGTTDPVAPKEGWMTVSEDGKKVVINHSKMIVGSKHQPWVVYNADAKKYANSTLEFDVTFSNPDSNQVGFINFAPAKVVNGKSYEGLGFDSDTSIKRYGHTSTNESYGDLANQSGIGKFEYNTKYHLRMVIEDNNYTAYITAPGGEEKTLASFTGVCGVEEGHYGFRIWRGGKTITLENISYKEIAKSCLSEGSVQVDKDEWGNTPVTVPITISDGDSVASVTCDGVELAETAYAVDTEGSTFTLTANYVKNHAGSFSVKVNFALGNVSTLWVVKHTGGLQEYIWTPDKGIDEWVKLGGNGLVEMRADNSAMHLKGGLQLVNSLAPTVMNGEIEITCQILDDANPTAPGALFRTDMAGKTWQAVLSERHINGEAFWDMKTDKGSAQIIWDGNKMISRESVEFENMNGDIAVKDIKVKVRYVDDSITLWIDDQFAHTEPRTEAKSTLGGMGLYLGINGDVDVKRVEFREVAHFEEPETAAPANKSITNGELTVQLAGDFPRVIDYTLNGKVMKGAEKRYNYATINATDYPATATIVEGKTTADSITYHVIPKAAEGLEQTNVEFDVKFTVKPGNILEMLILDIVEPTDGDGKVTEVVFGIGLPQQPMFSANSTETGSNLGVAFINKNSRCYQDRWIDIPKKQASTTATLGVTLPILSNGQLSASMFNNVLIGGDEFIYRGFDLGEGVESVGVWNTEFVYRGLDEKKMMPFPSEPDETELYCRVAITEDTNDDSIVNWQDGANALRKVIGGITPGDEQAARSFFHVGYNFSSGVQQPFVQVADNMKRLSNYLDGFSQQLIFKGYANEGHDSGHSDFEDINRRAGGADDMNIAIAEADKIHSNMGIHINHHEAYPEAKMFNDHVISDLNTWYWMDQARVIRREVDYLEGTFKQRMVGTDDNPGLFKKTPNLDFVYVDCWGEDRWGEKQLIGGMMEGGAEIFGNENAGDFTRFGVWTHSTAGNSSQIHQYAYNSQKDIYGDSGVYWGGYNRAASMMSWQHNNNINSLVSQFYTNQLPQKYLMCHDIIRLENGTGYFTDGITSSNYTIMKDGNKITDGGGKIFIPWYDEGEDIKSRPDPDEAAKIYHWNSAGGNSTWTLPENWNNVETAYLYKTTQNGKVLVGELAVTNHQVTINAVANTPYVVYPSAVAADVTEWSVGSPLKDTMFNSRDFSIWEKVGEADIAFNDDGNGVSILTIEGKAAGQVSQIMTGLEIGQKYRVKVDAGAENGKTARITVKNGDETASNYLEQVGMNNNYFDDYARGKPVQRMWVDFTATAETAEVILSADACIADNGKVTFMQTRIVKTAEPALPNGSVANETFEYVEQGAYGIFNPEGAVDGAPHLSETHLPYTQDTINGDWSLKLVGARGQATSVRTSPATMRLEPNTAYVVELDLLGNGWIKIESETDGTDLRLNKNVKAGHSSFDFITGDKTDYIARIGGSVLDDFQVWRAEDPTPPTAPTNLAAAALENDNAVKLTWTAATDDDGRIGGYKIYRDGTLLTTVGDVTEYTDRDTEDETEYTYQVSAVNAGQTEGLKSGEVTATTKILLPLPVSAVLVSGATATVVFNKPMEKAGAETVSNYTLTGVTGAMVTAAALSADGKTVTLTLAGMTASDSATLKIENVKDASGKHTIPGTETFTLSFMDHYFKLDEAADADAVDETGKTNGVKSANITSVAGKIDKAASFNGDGYIDVDSDALYRMDNFTVSTWINWDGSKGVNAIVGNDVSGDANSQGIIFFVDGGSGVLRTNSNICAVVGDASKPVTKNAWHHVAFVKQTGSAQVYLDGELIGNANVQFGKEERVPFRIGGSQKSGGGLSYPFNGAIDEVKIFAAGLSAADIAVLAGMELAPTPEAAFEASTMLLSNVTAGMKYSVDSGSTWVDITDTTANLTDAVVTAANGIWVKQPGDGQMTVDSEIQKIVLTQAAAPEGVTAKNETSARNDGALVGTSTTMEYRAQGGTEWTACAADSTAVAPKTYEVRIAAKGTVLASESVTVMVNRYSTPPSGDGGSTTKPPVVTENPDGSTTKTVTDKKTGNVTETTTYPDGTKIVATTPKDGATTIKVTVPKDKEKSTVTIPTAEQPKPGEVAVIIHEDGTREIIKTSVSTKDGLRVTLDASCKLEIVDNSKSFADVPADHWGADAIAFVTSRELFNGGDGGFQPAGDMSRAMLFTVLARLDGQDLTGGETWYENAMLWAKESGVSDGTSPDACISREQLAVMLYRYAKAEKVEAELTDLSDAGSVSDWAAEAMAWTVKSGIITGKSGTLDPQGNATRAEVAAMLQRFVENIN